MNIVSTRVSHWIAATALCVPTSMLASLPTSARAQAPDPFAYAPVERGTAAALDARLNEQIMMLPRRVGDATTLLQTTVFKPDGAGPFPLLVLNHGKNPGDTHQQPRSRHLRVAGEFVRRGYVVAIPMRQGFAGSGGEYPLPHCNIPRHGFDQAEDVVAALDSLVALPYVDRSRVVVAGQSDGGLTTIALGTKPIPGVRGLPQFMYDAYRSKAMGPAMATRMIDIGVFGQNSHDFFDSPEGVQLWSPPVAEFLRWLALPY